MTKPDYAARAERISEAIKNGNAKQVEIAEYCECSEQAVARWKKTGQMDSLNRYRLSELSGYRYLYLRDGILPERYETHSENLEDFIQSGDCRSVTDFTKTNEPPELAHLIAKIKIAHQARLLKPSSIAVLSELVNELTR